MPNITRFRVWSAVCQLVHMPKIGQKIYSTILKTFLCCLNTRHIFSNCLKFSQYSTPFIDMLAFISMVSSTSWCVYIEHEDFKKAVHNWTTYQSLSLWNICFVMIPGGSLALPSNCMNGLAFTMRKLCWTVFFSLRTTVNS